MVVLVEPFRRGFVVIRSYRKYSVHAHRFRFLGQRDHFRRVVTACSGEHGNAARGFFQRDFHDSQVLALAERRILTRGTAGHQKVDSRIDLAAHQAVKGSFVERRITTEWSD